MIKACLFSVLGSKRGVGVSFGSSEVVGANFGS